MNEQELAIYNDGERLVPYVSHDEYELIRHRSSYAFFRKVIENDLKINSSESTITNIVDLGFGSGYGCSILASLPNTRITGIDNSLECEEYANQFFKRDNVKYQICDLTDYMPSMPRFDYVLSRGVLEHVPNGLELIKTSDFTHRLIIDVPYKEQPGNEHHIIHDIDENTFEGYDFAEIFYEDLSGNIYSADNKPESPNLIILALRKPSVCKITDIISFPIAPCSSSRVEFIKPTPNQIVEHIFSSPDELINQAYSQIRKSSVVLEIGPGIYPMSAFKPELHILAEPCHEYRKIIADRFSSESNVLILSSDALHTLSLLESNSVDSVFLIDVIEHLPKFDGEKCIEEMKRVACGQIIVFTPYGYMPQDSEDSIDSWGLSGGRFQKHLSGWVPEDFGSEWLFFVCPKFHQIENTENNKQHSYGAFYAIFNCHDNNNSHHDSNDRLVFKYPFQEYQEKFNILERDHKALQKELQENLEYIQSLQKLPLDFMLKAHKISSYLKHLPKKIVAKTTSDSVSLAGSTESDMKTIFTKIFLDNTWGSDVSHSGGGSDLIQTEVIRSAFPFILSKYSIHSMLDIPCGDFYWMDQIELTGINYFGGDVVPELIAMNQKHSSSCVSFSELNIISDPLPKVDLVFCRDLLVHFSTTDIQKALENIKASGSKYLLTTYFSDRIANSNIKTGEWRPLNLLLPPFNFSKPIYNLNEGCTEYGSDWSDKSLGLWRISEI